jgi:hypothetical protein
MKLVSVQNSKISHSDGQISVGMLGRIEHGAMTWTVHRLQSVFLSGLLMNEEHILPVFEIMATHFPKFGVVEIG